MNMNTTDLHHLDCASCDHSFDDHIGGFQKPEEKRRMCDSFQIKDEDASRLVDACIALKEKAEVKSSSGGVETKQGEPPSTPVSAQEKFIAVKDKIKDNLNQLSKDELISLRSNDILINKIHEELANRQK